MVTEQFFERGDGERKVYQSGDILWLRCGRARSLPEERDLLGEDEVSQEYGTRKRGLPESGLYFGFVAGRTSMCSNAIAPFRMVWAPGALFGIADQYFPEGMCIMWHWP